MKRNRILKMLIGIVALFLVSAVTYGIVRVDDPYKYHTGLGETISISPDDQEIAFSYYVYGDEAIYTANIDGSNVEKVANSEEKRLHGPKYTPNGKQILYLAKDTEGINSLFIVDHDGSNPEQLTDEELHVDEAVFSPADETVYYIGMDAAEFKKDLGMANGGFDLFSVKPGDGNENKLTDKDYLSMSNLFVSSDEKQVLYSQYDGEGNEDQAFSIEDKTIESTTIKRLSNDHSISNSEWSPDEKKMAFTAVSEESKESSLFKYDLFLKDMDSGDTERLTDLNAAVDSPVFFQNQAKIAFLENTSWPHDPAAYDLRTVDLGDKALTTVELDTPKQGGQWFMKNLNRAVNGYTMAALYVLLFGLITVYVQYNKKKVYLPAIVSFLLAITVFIAGIIAAAVTSNPWLGIGLGMLAAAIFVCSLIVLVFAFVFRRVVK